MVNLIKINFNRNFIENNNFSLQVNIDNYPN